MEAVCASFRIVPEKSSSRNVTLGPWPVDFHTPIIPLISASTTTLTTRAMIRTFSPDVTVEQALPGIAPNLERGSMNIGQIVSELKKERDDLNRAIAALEGIGGRRSQKAKISEKASTAQTSRKRRRGLSAAGRRRISEAMKKRWAERRAKVTPLRKSTKAA
jgi:hypothetical protein